MDSPSWRPWVCEEEGTRKGSVFSLRLESNKCLKQVTVEDKFPETMGIFIKVLRLS